jgi:hypothetical protein
MERNPLRKWIVEHTEEEHHEEIHNMTFLSYPYEKYGEYLIAFKEGGGCNISICNLSKAFTDGLYDGYEETLPFVEYLGERMVLALNYFKGKSNEEIETAIKAGEKMDNMEIEIRNK